VARVSPDVTRVAAGLAAAEELTIPAGAAGISDVVIFLLETVALAAATQEPTDQATTEPENFWRIVAGLAAGPTATMTGTVDSTGGLRVASEVGSALRAVVVKVAGQAEVTVPRKESKRP